MVFKNALNLLIDNFVLNFKLLLYKIIIGVLAIALSAALLYPTLNMLFTSSAFNDVLDLLHQFFKALASGDSAFLAGFAPELQDKISALLAFIRERSSNVVFFFVSLTAILLITRFLGGMGNYVFGKVLDDRMSSYAKTSVSGAFVSNLGRAALWHVVYVPVTFVYDILVVALCYVFFLILLSIISVGVIASVVALMLSVALLIASQAVKLTLFSDAVPAMVSDGMSLGAALKKSFRIGRSRFASLFATYLITVYIILLVNVLGAIASFGAALLITIPMTYIMLIAIQFVSYYEDNKKKYFLAADNIVKPKEDKSEENFYDDFEI